MPKEDGSIGDVMDAFWRTIEMAVPPFLEEVTVVWAVSDPRLLRVLKALPQDEESKTEGGPHQRYIQPRLVLYANDAQFIDPTQLAPNTVDAKRASRFSTAKKGSGRKGGSQGSDGSRGSSRNARGGKGNAKNASAPSDAAPPNFLEPGVDVDEILYECQTFGDFIEKQMILQKQKTDVQRALDAAKLPNSDCAPHLRVMLAREEPVSRLMEVSPEDLPTPFEAHLNMQTACPVGTKPAGVATPEPAVPTTARGTASAPPRRCKWDSIVSRRDEARQYNGDSTTRSSVVHHTCCPDWYAER